MYILTIMLCIIMLLAVAIALAFLHDTWHRRMIRRAEKIVEEAFAKMEADRKAKVEKSGEKHKSDSKVTMSQEQ